MATHVAPTATKSNHAAQKRRLIARWWRSDGSHFVTVCALTIAAVALFSPPWGRRYSDLRCAVVQDFLGFRSAVPMITRGWNGRRYAAVVMSLPTEAGIYGNQTRLKDFAKDWKRVWPELQVRRQPTFAQHHDLRGYGDFVGFYMALNHAIVDQSSAFDYLILFEDDALPSPNATWPSANGPNTLDSMIDDFERVGGSALFLGGHMFKGFDREEARRASLREFGGVVPANWGTGSFAVVLPQTSAQFFFQGLTDTIKTLTIAKKVSGIDITLWDLVNEHRRQGLGSGGYLATPLITDHRPGWSATWQRMVSRPNEGRSDYWDWDW